ncbi:MAG: transporter [Ramlibacter sp.]|jgi:capsular polysaccharide transport system permease protein|nr:transporter [Ramlibacter sp.]
MCCSLRVRWRDRPQAAAGGTLGMEKRTPFAITLAVWKALFLREALGRMFSSRGAWFWLFAEPAFHVAYLMVLFGVIRVSTVGGIEKVVWILVGLLAFFAFRRTADQVINALSANRALYTYRQVKPADTVLVRGFLEAFLLAITAAIVLAGAALIGYDVVPTDPLSVLEAFFGLWLVGLGVGLIVSVVADMVPELGRIFRLMMMPMYLLSGVMFPISVVPQPYRDWLLLNPVAHGLEAARLGFASNYHAVPGLSIPYLYGFALVSMFIGLLLHRRFASRLVSQ